jgi:hypothetical protein
MVLAWWPAPGETSAQARGAAVVEAARAQADEPLRRPEVPVAWENITSTATPELRHRQSGAVCRFWSGRVFAGVHEPADGQRVWCSTHRGDYSLERTLVPAGAAFRPGSLPAFNDQKLARTSVVGPREWVSRWAAVDPWGAVVRVGPQRSLSRRDGSTLVVDVARADFFDGKTEVRHSAAVVRGWMVQHRATGPKARRADLDRLADADLVRLVDTISRSRPGPVPMGLPPSPINDPAARRVVSAFRDACVRPALARRRFSEAIAALGWERAQPPPGLPNIGNKPASLVWRAPGEGGDVFVHLDAVMNGDCAVSAYNVMPSVVAMAVEESFTSAADAPLAPGEPEEIGPGVVSRNLAAAAWEGGGVLITNDDAGQKSRPVVFVGLAPRRP